MNFGDYGFNDEIKVKLSDFALENGLPHAVIICGGNKELRDDVTRFLCSYAVCSGTDSPCFKCGGCKKVSAMSHPDVRFVEGDKKTKSLIYSKDVVESVIRNTAIVPNEANTKVYVFADADEKLPVISQNALLKTLEEPPRGVLFILTCKNPGLLLETVHSRCFMISLPEVEEFSPEGMEIAKEFALAIVDINEYNLLKAAYKLNKKDIALSVLPPLKEIMRESLILSVGGSINGSKEVPGKLIRKLTREKILKLLDILESVQRKLDSNVNMNLLAVWMCTEFRRITWQK